jgi:Ca2+-binding EF-hand superfamily protein
MAAQWEMQTPKGWVDVPFKAPPSGAAPGVLVQCVFEGAPLEVQFLSATNAAVKTKGKTYEARVKAPAAFSPPQRAAADAAFDEMNPLVIFDAMATEGAVRPKEFAAIIQLEASAVLKKVAEGYLQAAEAGALPLPNQPGPIPPQVIAGLRPAIQRGVERLDFSHMRHLLEMLFRVMDGNKNGKIERDEFEKFFSNIPALAMDPGAAADFAFSMVDKNGNGKLSLDEAQEVIDSVCELVTTLVASFADVAESIVNDNAFKDTSVNFVKMALAEQGVQDGAVQGGCDVTGNGPLTPGPDWYHKPGSSSDLCKEAFDGYEGEDKAQYILIDTKEKLGADLDNYGVDFSNLVSRDKLAKKLEESGFLDMMAAAFADDGVAGPKQQIVSQMKVMRQSFAKFEADTGAQLYMKAMEWRQGGVDEATFVSQVVPILRENQKARMDEMTADPMAMVQQQFDAMSAGGAQIPEEHKAMIAGGVEAVAADFLPALKRGQERGSEYLPEYARALFRFLDIDCSGFITKKEIQLLKALLDALLHLGERACHDLSSGELKPMEGDYKDNGKELAFAIFDVLDRDGDQHLSLDEIIAFGQKVVTLWLSMMRTMAHMVIECIADELLKTMAEVGWKKAGLTEVGKDEFAPMLMMAPMALQGMMQG